MSLFLGKAYCIPMSMLIVPFLLSCNRLLRVLKKGLMNMAKLSVGLYERYRLPFANQLFLRLKVDGRTSYAKWLKLRFLKVKIQRTVQLSLDKGKWNGGIGIYG